MKTTKTPFTRWINPSTSRVRVYFNDLPPHRYQQVWGEQVPGSNRLAIRCSPIDTGSEWQKFQASVRAILVEQGIESWSDLHTRASETNQTFTSQSTPQLRRTVAVKANVTIVATNHLGRQDLVDILLDRKPFTPRLNGTVPTPAEQPDMVNMIATMTGIAEAVCDSKMKGFEAKTSQPLQIVFTHPTKRETREIRERTHKMLPKVLRLIQAGLPVYLVGPTGSGKTTLAEQAAKALGLDFTFNSMTAGVTESSILGRMLPQSSGDWKYQPAPFVNTYKDGGLHLFDELDASDPNMLLIVNSAIANDSLSVPFAGTKPFKRHRDTVIIGAANTFGIGATRQYVGRNALDAATLDRFAVSTVEIDYDRELEEAIVGSILGNEDVAPLLQWGWRVRDAINRSQLRRNMSTRTLINSAKILAAGGALSEVQQVFTASWSADEKAKVL